MTTTLKNLQYQKEKARQRREIDKKAAKYLELKQNVYKTKKGCKEEMEYLLIFYLHHLDQRKSS